MTNKEIIEVRRKMLAKWIDDNYDSKHKQAEFVKDINKRLSDLGEKQIAQAVVSGLVNLDPNNERTFGEKMARRIEHAAGMPDLYLDNLTSRKIKKMMEPGANARQILAIFEKLNLKNKLAILGAANDLLTEQGTELGTDAMPYESLKEKQ